jgi:hypothetical protein
VQASVLSLLPSSQASFPTFSPSPQIGVQEEGEPVQVQPVTRLQFTQPSGAFASPSSHSSGD